MTNIESKTPIDLAFKSSLSVDRMSRDERELITEKVPFGTKFTEHMVTADWDPDQGWHNGALEPYHPLALDPASVGLHYGQVVFEGLKAYRQADESIAVFRPQRHAERFRESCERLMMTPLPDESFVSALRHLLVADEAWIPAEPERSVYLRPLMFASEVGLALRPALTYKFVLIAFVTEKFFGVDGAIDVWISRAHARAMPGGTGQAKCAGNYAASFAAQADAIRHDCDQVVWLDAVHRRYVEELGGMNLFFVERTDTGPGRRLVTPPLGETILAGITRECVIELGGKLGYEVVERRMTVEEWRSGCANGRIVEAFACGTAAQISAIGRVRDGDETWQVGDGTTGPLTRRIDALLAGIHRGTEPDFGGWMFSIR